jgi:hypothetical protein
MSKIYSAGDQKFEAIELLDSVKLMNENEETWEATWETHVEALHSFFGEFNHWSGDAQGVDIEGPFGSLHADAGQYIVKLKWDIFLVLSAEDFQKEYTLVVKAPRQDVSEENSKDIIATWYATRVSNSAELAEFVRHLNEDYNHDYGTVVHATAASSLAAGHLLASQQGITGFQAGCVNWEWIKRWNCWEGPMQIRRFQNMLYPQYDYTFGPTISTETWKWLQEQAVESLARNSKEEEPLGASTRVVEHWQSIVAGEVPFGYTVKDT